MRSGHVQVADAAITGTVTGHDPMSGLEYTAYVLRCTAAAAEPKVEKTALAAALAAALAMERGGTEPEAGAESEGDGALELEPEPEPGVEPAQWYCHKRFSAFEELRRQLLAVEGEVGETIGALAFPAKTWAAP